MFSEYTFDVCLDNMIKILHTTKNPLRMLMGIHTTENQKMSIIVYEEQNQKEQTI